MEEEEEAKSERVQSFVGDDGQDWYGGTAPRCRDAWRGSQPHCWAFWGSGVRRPAGSTGLSLSRT